jgi:hypothetical protein
MRLKILLCLVAFVVISICIYGYLEKTKTISAPFDYSESALLYYRGLGLCESNQWFGRIKTKIAMQDNSQYVFAHGCVTFLLEYFPSGKLKTEAPVVEIGQYRYITDGLSKVYFENGKISQFGGGRIRRAGENFDDIEVPHGIDRSFDENGKIIKDEYYLDGHECSKEQWLEHLKKHPEDIKYGR